MALRDVLSFKMLLSPPLCRKLGRITADQTSCVAGRQGLLSPTSLRLKRKASQFLGACTRRQISGLGLRPRPEILRLEQAPQNPSRPYIFDVVANRGVQIAIAEFVYCSVIP